MIYACFCLIPFPNKPLVLQVCSICLLKTMCGKGELLVQGNQLYQNCKIYTCQDKAIADRNISFAGSSYDLFCGGIINV